MSVRAWTEGAVARVAMARPEKRNAQDTAMLRALDEAFTAAVADDDVRVIVLSGDGPHFCSGHDLGALGDELPSTADWLAYEEDVYLGLHRRWWNLPKPTIAMVQGACLAGGLATAWVCDLIVAADDARFADPVITMGMNGQEWFVHPYELGARKAKELLFTAEPIDAAEAHRLGMVNHVVARDDLEPFTMDLAGRIAHHDPLALKLAKRSVNAALDAQGQGRAIDHAFALHHFGHTRHRVEGGSIVSAEFLEQRRRRSS